jgi:hypothetical protein
MQIDNEQKCERNWFQNSLYLLYYSAFFIFTIVSISCKVSTQSSNLESIKNTTSTLVKEWGLSAGMPSIPKAQPGNAQFCSFNIQFLGSYTSRDSGFLADTLKHCDLVAVQELVGSPRADMVLGDQNQDGFIDSKDDIVHPKRTTKLDPDAKVFFDNMELRGFKYVLSNTKTGKGNLEGAGNSAEFTVIFYKDDQFEVNSKFSAKFIHSKIFENEIFDRVPYAIYFKSKLGGRADFGILSVHLHFLSKKSGIESDFNNLKVSINRPELFPLKISDEYSKSASIIANESSYANAAKRGLTQKKLDQFQRFLELKSISNFIDQEMKSNQEMDWMIIGDMNISSKEEIRGILSHLSDFKTLNPDNLFSTNSHMDEAYDHALVLTPSRGRPLSFEFPERLHVLNQLCRATLLEEPPPVKKAILPKFDFSRRELDKDETCARMADEKFRKSSKFLAPMFSGENEFWTEFRTRYSDHNPIFFEVPIPGRDRD